MSVGASTFSRSYTAPLAAAGDKAADAADAADAASKDGVAPPAGGGHTLLSVDESSTLCACMLCTPQHTILTTST